MKYVVIEKTKTCFFTGHRPQKLAWGFNEKDERCIQMKNIAEKKILSAIDKGYIYFMSGMALGFDTICAEIVLKLRKQYKDIKLICVIPCKSQPDLWSKEQKKRYLKILKKSDGVICLRETYTNTCMFERNEYMIKHSSLCIALFNGEKGGTKMTLDKAKAEGVEVEEITI